MEKKKFSSPRDFLAVVVYTRFYFHVTNTQSNSPFRNLNKRFRLLTKAGIRTLFELVKTMSYLGSA
jgi:hypothetical protein